MGKVWQPHSSARRRRSFLTEAPRMINNPPELPTQGLRGKHAFSCALPTRGGICDCIPEDSSAAVKLPVATPVTISSAPQAMSAAEA
jgi:hypothetical protein